MRANELKKKVFDYTDNMFRDGKKDIEIIYKLTTKFGVSDLMIRKRLKLLRDLEEEDQKE